MENLGTKPLPYKMTRHGNRHYEGSYILVKFDSPTSLLKHVEEELHRDTDVIRKNIFDDEEFVKPCLTGPCLFGELPNPDHEKTMWYEKVHRRFARRERRKGELLRARIS